MNDYSRRLVIELSTAAASAVLLLVTLVWRDWIELVFRVDPDARSGSFEWALVAVAAVAAASSALAARVEWRRLRGAGDATAVGRSARRY